MTRETLESLSAKQTVQLLLRASAEENDLPSCFTYQIAQGCLSVFVKSTRNVAEILKNADPESAPAK